MSMVSSVSVSLSGVKLSVKSHGGEQVVQINKVEGAVFFLTEIISSHSLSPPSDAIAYLQCQSNSNKASKEKIHEVKPRLPTFLFCLRLMIDEFTFTYLTLIVNKY